MRKTFLTFCVAALSLLAVSSCGKIEDSLNKLDQGLKDLAARVDKLEKDLGKEIKTLVATGGLAKEIISCCDKDIIFNKDLVLQGLLSIYRKNR
jgi:pantothenate kinase type III